MSRRRRRRMNGCLKSIITLLVVLVIFVAAIYAGGMFAWGKFAQEKTGITYSQALSLASGLYSGKEKKIVAEKDKYTEKDLDSFYTDLKEALFLDEKVNLQEDFSKVIMELVSQKNNNAETEVATTAATTESETTEETNTSLTGNETLDNFLKSLDFDFSSLKEYEDEYLTPHVLNINGKQLAAFLNDAIKNIVSSDLVKEKVPEQVGPINLTEVDLTKAVRIPQIVIDNKDFTDATKLSFKMTVALELRNVAKQALQSINKSLGAVAFLIPKTIFVSVTIFPQDPTQPAEIDINGFNEKRTEALHSLLNVVLKTTEYGSFEGLMQKINEIVIQGIEKIESVVPIVFLDNGSVEAKPIKALMSALKVTNLTESQFFCMIRDICLPTFDDVKESLNIKEEGVTVENLDERLNAALDVFIIDASKKYAIEDNYLKKDKIYTQLTTINSSDPEKESLEDHIDMTKLASNLTTTTYDAGSHKMPVKYVAFAGILNSYLNENPINMGELNIDFKVINAYFDDVDGLSLVIKANLRAALLEKVGEDSIASVLISQLIPDSLYITATVKLDEEGASIKINNNNEEETIAHLDTIIQLGSSFGVSVDSFNYEDLKTKISSSVREGLQKMQTELKTVIIFSEEKALLPSVFEILAAAALKEAGVENPITDEDLYLIVYDLKKSMPQSFEEAATEMNIAETQELHDNNKTVALGTFITNLTTKYAIEQLRGEETENFITPNNVYEKITNVKSENNENSLINRIKIANLHSAAETYSVGDYRVETSYLALTKLLGDYIKKNEEENPGGTGSSLTSENYELMNVQYNETENKISLFIRVELFTLINLEPGSTVDKIARKILPEDIFLQVDVKLEKVEGNIACDVLVVGLDKNQSKEFLNRIIRLGQSIGADLGAFDYTSLTNNLGEKVFNGIDNIKTNMGVEITFTNDNCYMPSIYEVMANKILYKEIVDPTDRNLEDAEVFRVIQGLSKIPDAYATTNKIDLNDNAEGFLKDFNNKYAVANEHKLSTTKKDPITNNAISIVDQITSLSTNYDDAIVGSTLASNWNDAIGGREGLDLDSLVRNMFAPIISEGELVSLFGNAVTITSSGLENIQLSNVYIENADQMTLIFSCEYVQSNEANSYSSIIPEFVIKLVLDKSKIVGDEVCCEITINDLPYTANSGEHSDLENFNLMCARLSSTAFSIETTKADCNTIIKDKFSDLFAKVPVRLIVDNVANTKYAQVGAIYEVIYSALNNPNEFDASDIAETIAALHESVEIAGQITYAPTNPTQRTVTGQNLGQIIINKGFSEISSALGVASSNISLYQTAIVHIEDGGVSALAADDLRRGFTDKFAYTWAAGGYAVATLKISTVGMSYASSLLPQELYVTAITSLQNGETEAIYNYFTDTQTKVLDALAGTQINMATVKADMKTYINDLTIYGTYTLGNVILSGIGSTAHSEQGNKVNGEYIISIPTP